MKVGILGSGDVGRALGGGFVGLRHEVLLGSREPDREKAREWLARQGSLASVGTFADAASFGELVVLATRWDGIENAISLATPASLAGKVVIDVTNPIEFPDGGFPRLALGHDDSAGERVQRWLPASKVVKAFNIVSYAYMVRPDFPCGPPDMFICGNDVEAKKTVAEITEAFGWPTTDIGGIEGARLLEPLAALWITYGVITGTWTHAFKVLRK